MRSNLHSSLIPVGLLAAALLGTSYVALSGEDPIPGTEPISIGTPKKEGPIAYLGGSPTLTAGFQDWALCELCAV